MTPRPWDPSGHASDAVPAVVVVLFAGREAADVARVAVRRVAGISGRLRIIQVHGTGSAAERDVHDEITFTAASRILREHPGLPVTFEAVALDGNTTAAVRPQARAQVPSTGEARPEPVDRLGHLVLARAAEATLLVLGNFSKAEAALIDHCRAHAPCEVLVVRHSDTSRVAGDSFGRH